MRPAYITAVIEQEFASTQQGYHTPVMIWGPPGVGKSAVVHQICEGNESLIGAMIESNLESGNQPIPAHLGDLRYGVSVTDACVDWSTTERMLRDARTKLRDIVARRLQ